MKAALITIGTAVAIAAVVIVGTRLSDDALALLVGVTCGGGIGIPISVLLVWALVRRTGGREQSAQGQSQQYPPVIVIGGNGQPLGLPGMQQSHYPSLPPPGPRREFKMVPDDEWQDDL